MSVTLQSGQIIASLISAANAKTGGNDSDLTAAVQRVMDGFGGGSEIVEKELLQASQDMTIKQVLDAVTVKLKYEKSAVQIVTFGGAAPTSGDWTLNNFCLLHIGALVKSARHYYLAGQANFNSFPRGITNEDNSTFSIGSDGALKSNQRSTSACAADGSIVRFVEIPINCETLQVDLTPWGPQIWNGSVNGALSYDNAP